MFELNCIHVLDLKLYCICYINLGWTFLVFIFNKIKINK